MHQGYNKQTEREIHGEMTTLVMRDQISRYVCDTCNQAFAHKKNYDDHCLKHDLEQIVTMSTDASSSNTCALSEKMNLKEHVCTQCGKSYKRKDHLKRHELIHTGERPHICLICMKSFVRKDKLTRHENIHFKDKRNQFSCPLCKKVFLRKDSLEKHKRNTHNEVSGSGTQESLVENNHLQGLDVREAVKPDSHNVPVTDAARSYDFNVFSTS